MRIAGFLFFVLLVTGTVLAQTPSPATTTDTNTVTTDQAVAETQIPPPLAKPDTVSTSEITDTLVVTESGDTATVEDSGTDSIAPADSNTTDASTTQTETAPIIEEIEEDLILDGGEESILAPVATEPSIQQNPDSSDSGAVRQQSAETADSSAVSSDAQLNAHNKMISRIPNTPTTEATPKPLLIEKTQSINFAKNYKEYRSPKVAILLSLLVPGAGQAYSHNKLKAGIFGAVEVAFIAAGAIVGYQGNQRMKAARSFADEHYSIDSMSTYYTFMSNSNELIDFDSLVFYGEYNDFLNQSSKKSQSYYNDISDDKRPYIQGWDDVTPRFTSDFVPINNSDSGTYIVNPAEDSTYLVSFVDNNGDTSDAAFGFSENQKTFSKKLSKANVYFRWSKGLFSMLLVNHIISAIDAGITAKAYNDQLLGKTSLWQKINLRENFVRTPGGTAQGYALEVRF